MFLEKEDVSLYYEVRGQGQPLLLIHGVIVDGGLYKKAAGVLAEILGKKEIYYPGCHNFPYDRPEEFAACILETLNGNYSGRSVHLH